MELFLTAIIILLFVVIIFLYRKTSKTINRIDRMIESAINDTFSEEDFSEEKLSRLEGKMYRYLSKGKTAQQQLTVEKNAIKELVSDISHQSKTPIANILLYTQLLAEREGLDEEAKGLAAEVENQTEKLNFLIQSLIKTSRLESGIITLMPEENRIGDLLASICTSFLEVIENGKLVLDEPTKVKELRGCFDLKWTAEAISNIVDNAIKYTPESGSVTLSAKDYEMFVRIDIRDTGIGISEEETARIFLRFYRSPRVKEEKGIGIGLYLAREIVTREGGYIKVDSELGKGSLFSVFLPKQAGNLSKL